jgi:superfamily I DNA/RNA helicase/mRNA-degrading endonuclease RelE of RelBE toxin-antitoxin system
MNYKIVTVPAFMSDFVSSPRSIQKKFTKEVLPNLEISPDFQRGKKTKKLRGYSKLWRYALTDPEYRIIYEVDRENKSVKLLMMGPRKDDTIYKRLHYIPDKGPEKISMEVAPHVDPEYIGAHYDKLDLFPSGKDDKKIISLPKISREQLNMWHIQDKYWNSILKCTTEDELLNTDIPQEIKLRIIDCIFPGPVENAVSQAQYIIENEQDIEKVRDGKLSRLLLNLDKEQLSAIDKNRNWPIMIKGGPGTGKSILAIYKAAGLIKKQQEEMFEPPRVLFTTYTRLLSNTSRELLNAYLGDINNSQLDIRTVNQKASNICRKAGYDLDYIEDEFKENIIQSILNKCSNEERKSLSTRIDAHYLVEEFEWVIEGWDLREQNDYLSIQRPGRRVPLNERQRKIVWRLYNEYRKILKEKNKHTYEEAQSIALSVVNKSDGKNKYDYVFVDEAQDLKPVGLRLCAALCKNHKYIYITADMNQAIYGKGVSWNSVIQNLHFSGSRTTILKKNYRSTDQILRGAGDLIQGLEDVDSETVITEAVYTGQKPEFKRFQTQDERDLAIVNWIRSALKSLRLPNSCAAILCNTRNAVNEMVKSLKEKELNAVRFTKESSLDMPAIKVMPIHGSKGMEFPVVVIPDFRDNAFTWLEPQDKAAQIIAAQKLFFVASTRAMKRLLVCTVGNREDKLYKLLKEENWVI